MSIVEKLRSESSAEDGSFGVRTLTLFLIMRPVVGNFLENLMTGIRWWRREESEYGGPMGGIPGLV
jgi:hypothetical protein